MLCLTNQLTYSYGKHFSRVMEAWYAETLTTLQMLLKPQQQDKFPREREWRGEQDGPIGS
jgi:hypothetical protein